MTVDSAPPDHSKLLTASARKHLKPLGFQQKGRSRVWFKDNGWWLVLVEFQPSGWGKGSYLNVAAMWLWSATGNWTFNAALRRGKFAFFESLEQFEAAADELGRDARQHTADIESLFSSAEAASAYLATDVGANPWTSFHAMAAALAVRDLPAAEAHLDRLLAAEVSPAWAWVDDLKARAQRMFQSAQESLDPRQVVTDEIARGRELLRLGALSPDELWSRASRETPP